MAEQKKARGRRAAPAKAAAARNAPAKKRRTAKAASANTAEVKSMAVKSAEPSATKSEAPVLKAVEGTRPTANKAVDVLIETVEAVKAAAVRAAQSAPVQAQARPTAEAARAFAQAAPSPAQAIAPAAHLVQVGTEQAREAYARAQTTTEQLRHAVTETAAASARGALEVNGKVLDAMRAQNEAIFELWRSTLTAGSFADAVRAQASGARQVYETSTAHWRDVAETTTRWLGSTVKPMQSTWTDRSR